MNSISISSDTAQRYEMLQSGLDLLDQGITVFDANLRLVAWNAPFLRLLEFPPELAYVGAPFESFIRHNAMRGEYGPGDIESQIAQRVAEAANFAPHITERQRPNGKILLLRGEPLDAGLEHYSAGQACRILWTADYQNLWDRAYPWQ